MCLAIYFKDVGSPHALLKLLNERGHDLTLFNRAVTRLSFGRVHFGRNQTVMEVTSLVSGSYPYLQQAASEHKLGKTLYLLDEPWRGKTTPSPSTFVSWRRLKPTQFGGSTKYPVLMGWSGLAPMPTSTWLPNIQKNLDQAWIDQTAVSAKAAKSDA
jgi:hypothetical protein